jgi:hypothetical protein
MNNYIKMPMEQPGCINLRQAKRTVHACLDNQTKYLYPENVFSQRWRVDVGSVCYGGSQLNRVVKGATLGE